MYEDPKSKISQLGKVLDAREDLISKKIKRHDLSNRDITVNQDWNNEEFETEASAFNSTPVSKGWSLSVKILVGSVIFFILTILLVFYKFIGGGNIVSGNNIEVTIKAPVSVAGGEVLPFEIEIKNNNNVTLVGSDLGVVFPLGAKQVEDTALEAKRVQTFLGDILPGQSIKKNLAVVLFGEENEQKDINITLEYKVAGSNSLFNKNKTVSILISSAPVSIVVTGQKEVNTNQNVDFTVEISSNSSSVIKNLLLKADYPFGFTFKNSSPDTFSQNNLWLIGDLAPGAKRTIRLSGILSGQEGEERGFNFSLGSQSKNDTLSLEQALVASFSSVTIRRPFVSADITLNEESGAEYISSSGEKIKATINWQNNLQYEVSDVSIVVKMSGNALDKSSVLIKSNSIIVPLIILLLLIRRPIPL